LLQEISFYQGSITGEYDEEFYYSVLAYQMTLNTWDAGVAFSAAVQQSFLGRWFGIGEGFLEENGLVSQRLINLAKRDVAMGASMDGDIYDVFFHGDVILISLMAELAMEVISTTIPTVNLLRFTKKGEDMITEIIQVARYGKNGKYVPTPKHDPKSGWGSPNSIPDYVTGQKLLDSAYSSSNTKQLYNVYDGKLVKFQPDGSGGWHPYEVQSPIKEVPIEVLRVMLNDGLITKSQYNKWIKNK
jgi:hypothetical protein